MKMRVEKITVDAYKSGDREGDFKTFDLPDDAIVLHTHVVWGRAFPKALIITVAVPA